MLSAQKRSQIIVSLCYFVQMSPSVKLGKKPCNICDSVSQNDRSYRSLERGLTIIIDILLS